MSAPALNERAATRDRLRALIRRLESRPAPRPGARRGAAPGLEQVLPEFQRHETAAGPCLVREQVHPLDTRVGSEAIEVVRLLDGPTLARLAPGEALEDAGPSDLVYLDIETTGLGGAGALAFLVALGALERRGGAEAFVLRQYLAASPEQEAGVVAAAIADARTAEGERVLVTYNGRVFDAPILDGRAIMHRQRGGFEGMRHLDVLAPSRRGFRGVFASCRLQALAWGLFGHGRAPTEVDGAAVPAQYFAYLRTRDARWLAPVVEHNAEDVLALAALAGRLGGLLSERIAPSGVEALAMARILQPLPGEAEATSDALDRALALLPPSPARYEALMRRARLARAAGERDEACVLWREACDQPASPRIPPLVELAKHYEHHARDYAAALHVIDIALGRVEERRGDADWADRARQGLLARRGRVHSRLMRSTAHRH